MKLRKVKWHNHPILKNLELNFTKENGTTFNSVIIAGENGTGKTTILESISNFINKGSFEFFDFIEYEIDDKILHAIPSENENKSFYKIKDGTSITNINSGYQSDGSGISRPQDDENILNIRNYGCIYSKARADFQTKKITTVTTSELDKENSDSDKNDDFTSLKQLIVDVEYQDKNEYARVNKDLGESPKPWLEFYNDSKMFRFSNAFESFFENIKYSQVVDSANEKEILFEKNEIKISIDSLSTGEKQIVFRGIYILKNIKNLSGSTIMIDEPELSMHPKWQRKILDYYQNIFRNETTSELNSQLFFSTHSDHVLNSALSNSEENIVIVINQNGAHKIDSPLILPSITIAETNYLAFDIPSTDYHIQLFGFYQQKHSLHSIKSTDDKIQTECDYSAAEHFKRYNHPNGTTTYDTLPTYIRNCIDHPDSTHSYSVEELKKSIKLLSDLCK